MSSGDICYFFCTFIMGESIIIKISNITYFYNKWFLFVK